MITLDKVTYWYREGSNPVLRNVSLEINRGESVCVMGRNGSGKSTLAKLIAGLVNPGRGHISINGQAPTVDSGSSGVGILFQNPDNQMVATLVEKEIAFALENRAMPQPKMEREVSRIAERFEIGHLRRRLTSTLSGGEKQRVALASVMVQNPHVLVLDEPDSFLDEAGRRLLEAELARLHREYPGLIEIRITQDPSVAHSYKRLVVLDGGMVVADDKPAATFADSDFTHRAGLTYSLARKSELTVSAPLRAGTSAAELRVDRIVIDRVGFVYPMSTEILEDISLSLRRGELVGLVVPTGVGKTSLGLLACGILQPAAGTISYLDGSGRSISRSNLRGQVVALLQQPERQFFLDTCAREIAFGPSNLGYELSEMDIDGFFEMVSIRCNSATVTRSPFRRERKGGWLLQPCFPWPRRSLSSMNQLRVWTRRESVAL